jgi:hypothetical protein
VSEPKDTLQLSRGGAMPVVRRFDLIAAGCAILAIASLMLVTGIWHQRDLSRFLCAGLITAALFFTAAPKFMEEHSGGGVTKLGVGLTMSFLGVPLGFVLNGLNLQAESAAESGLAWAALVWVILGLTALVRQWTSRPRPRGVFYLSDEEAAARARAPKNPLWLN